MNIGEEIKSLRESKGISQKDFANMIHITSGYLSRIENGSSLQFLLSQVTGQQFFGTFDPVLD